MRIIAKHTAPLRSTSPTVALAVVSFPADAQLRPGAEDRAAALNAERQNQDAQPAQPAQLQAPARVIQHITVQGTQRVEPGTVLTYVNIHEGDSYDPANVDLALKALF